MKTVIGAALLALPTLAHAQTRVPAIQATATSTASASVAAPSDHSTASPPAATGGNEGFVRPGDDATADPAGIFDRGTVKPERAACCSAIPALGKSERDAAGRRGWLCPVPVRRHAAHGRLRALAGVQLGA